MFPRLHPLHLYVLSLANLMVLAADFIEVLADMASATHFANLDSSPTDHIIDALVEECVNGGFSFQALDCHEVLEAFFTDIGMIKTADERREINRAENARLEAEMPARQRAFLDDMEEV